MISFQCAQNIASGLRIAIKISIARKAQTQDAHQQEVNHRTLNQPERAASPSGTQTPQQLDVLS